VRTFRYEKGCYQRCHWRCGTAGNEPLDKSQLSPEAVDGRIGLQSIPRAPGPAKKHPPLEEGLEIAFWIPEHWSPDTWQPGGTSFARSATDSDPRDTLGTGILLKGVGVHLFLVFRFPFCIRLGITPRRPCQPAIIPNPNNRLLIWISSQYMYPRLLTRLSYITNPCYGSRFPWVFNLYWYFRRLFFSLLDVRQQFWARSASSSQSRSIWVHIMITDSDRNEYTERVSFPTYLTRLDRQMPRDFCVVRLR